MVHYAVCNHHVRRHRQPQLILWAVPALRKVYGWAISARDACWSRLR